MCPKLGFIFVRLRLMLSIFAQPALASPLTKRGDPCKNKGLEHLTAVAYGLLNCAGFRSLEL
jgi:hypothetical protein